METLAVKGHIIGGQQSANVNKITRLRLMLEKEMTVELQMSEIPGISQRTRDVSNAQIALCARILKFLENDSARRFDEQDAPNS